MLIGTGIISARYKITQTVASGLTNINFTSTSGDFVESPAGKWGDGTGYALSSQTLAASTSGYIQWEYQGATYKDTILGFDTVNGLEPYTGFDTGILVESGTSNIWYVSGGSGSNAGVSAAAGDLLRINRVGSTITAEYYRSGSWTVIFTYATYAGILYIKSDIAVAGNYLLNPKGSGIS